MKTLIKDGLLTKKECKAYDFGEKEDEIDYEKIYRARFKVLKKAYDRFEKGKDYNDFVNENTLLAGRLCPLYGDQGQK